MGRYDDIINLPHHVSSTRPQMPMIDRAAQFQPFRALTGYEDAVQETARLTDERPELRGVGRPFWIGSRKARETGFPPSRRSL